MSQILNSIRVTGFIAPSDSTDVYATHDSVYGRGGFTEVADLTERDAITDDRRREGKCVYVTADQQTYQLVGGIANSNWQIFGNAAATLGSYVKTVNSISGDVVLLGGNGIDITGLTISVSADYALNSTVHDASASLYTLVGDVSATLQSEIASVSGSLAGDLAAVSASLYAIDVSTSGNLYTIVGDVSSALYTLTGGTSALLQLEINNLTTATVDASSTLYSLIHDVSGNLYSVTYDVSSALYALTGVTSAALHAESVALSSTLYSTIYDVSSALYSVTYDVSSALYALNVSTSGNLHAETVAASSALYALVDGTSAALYAIDVATSGALTTLVMDVSAAVDGNYVHRTGNVNEQVFGAKDFINNTLFAAAVTICGDLYVAGSTTTVESSSVNVADRIITVNYGEPGVGVTHLYAGIEVDRGTGNPYYMVFDETRDAFVVGTPGGPLTDAASTLAELQVVATREDAPIDKAVAFWRPEDGVTSGGSEFVTDGGLLYNQATQTLSAAHIFYNPAAPGNWTSAPVEVSVALDDLAFGLVAAGSDLAAVSGALQSEMVAVSGALYTIIYDVSGALHTDLVGVSGALQSEMNAVSGALYTTIYDVSGGLYSTIYNVSGGLYTTIYDVSGALYTLTGGTSAVLQSEINYLTTATVDASSTLYSLIASTSGYLQSEMVTVSGALYTTVYDVSSALYTLTGGTSAVLHQEILDLTTATVDASSTLYALIASTSGNLQSEMVAVSGATVTLISDTSAALYAIDVSTSGNLYNLIQSTSGALYSIDVSTSGNLYTIISDVSGAFAGSVGSLSGAIDDLATRVTTLEVSANNHEVRIDNLETAVATIDNSLAVIMQGSVACNTSNYKYSIVHPSLDIASSFPMISLTVPTSSSVLYIQGVTNRSATGFDIVLSDVTDTTGYAINWTLPLSGSAVVVRAYGVASTTQAGGSYAPNAGANDSFELNYTGAVTINQPTSMADGQTINIIANSTAGGSSLTWVGYKFSGGSAPAATVSGTDIYTLLKKGSNYFVSYTQALG